MKHKLSLTIPNFAGYFLLAGIIVLFYFLYHLYSPFITSLIFAAFFATIFFSLFKRLRSLFRGRGRVAAFISCLLTLIVIAVPLSLFATLLIAEGVSAFVGIYTKVQGGFFQQYFNWEQGNFLYDQVQAGIVYLNENFTFNGGFNFDNLNIDLIKQVGETAQFLGKFLYDNFTNFMGNLFWFILSLIIFFFALYYFFKDGDLIMKKLMDLSPLPEKYEKAIFSKFKEVSNAMLFGIFFTAVIQGTLAGIGYAIVGINNPIFWATATAVFSLVPLVGTSVIWFPASVILIVMGNYVGGIGLFLWCFLFVATVDNFIRPYLIEGKAPVHPLLTFLAVFGGFMAFGLKGVLYGPVILNLLIALLHIYEMEYAKVLKN